MAERMELTKAMIQASWTAMLANLFGSHERASTDYANGDCGQGKGIADDAADTEGGALAVAVSVFHFAQRRVVDAVVCGHVRGGRRREGERESVCVCVARDGERKRKERKERRTSSTVGREWVIRNGQVGSG